MRCDAPTFRFLPVVLLALTAALAVGQVARPEPPKIGEPAPVFTLEDTDGGRHDLAAYKGRIVVLEWTDPECPYVERHYEAKGRGASMLDSYKKAKAKDETVVWLAVNSTRSTKAAPNAKWKKDRGIPYPILLDPDGRVGRQYDARRTPQIFVIDREGVLRYAGAVDDDRLGTKPPGETTNYALRTVRRIVDGKPIEPSTVKAYGCSIKY